MRTTLSIDDDVLLAAKQLAGSTGQTVGQALSALARKGLTSTNKRGQRGGVTLLPVHEGARPVTLEEVNRLRDELP